jgi:thiol-disulfide isomerase/thioredoxin
MKKIVDIEQLKEKMQHQSLTLLFIKTANCGVCDAVLAQTEELLKKFPRIESALVSLEDTPKVAAEYLVFTAPTLILFAEGKEVLRESRFVAFEKFEHDIQRWYDLMNQ